MHNNTTVAGHDYSISTISLSVLERLLSTRSELLADAPLHYQPSYLELLEKHFAWKPRHLIISRDGKPVLFMPAFEVKPHFKWAKLLPGSIVRTIQSLPRLNPGGFLHLEQTSREDFQQILNDAIGYHVREHRANFVRIFDVVFDTTLSPLADPLPVAIKTSDKLSVRKWGYWSSIRGVESIDEIWTKRLKQNARGCVRFAERAGVHFEVSDLNAENLHVFCDMYRRHFFQLNNRLPRRMDYFERLLNFFPKRTFLMVAYVEKEPVSGSLFTVINHCFTGLHLVSLPISHKYKANNFVAWKSIECAWDLGARVFDLGPSQLDDKSHIAFKSSMGSYPYPIIQYEYRTSRISALQKLLRSN